MTISARLQITQAADRRGWTRRSLSLGSSLQATGEDVLIHDVSATGMLIETAAGLAVLDDLQIELPEAGFTAAVVTWNSGSYYGCQFKERISQAAISAAVLRSPPAQPTTPEPSFERQPAALATEPLMFAESSSEDEETNVDVASVQRRKTLYKISGDRDLRPTSVSTDGSHTYIRWPADRALPAVFAIGADGQESIVNGGMRGDEFVVDGVPGKLRFRIDRHVATAERLRIKVGR